MAERQAAAGTAGATLLDHQQLSHRGLEAADPGVHCTNPERN
ncbi:MAG: hypothetical protein AAF648_10300 [Pseudomonadota bacterium]